MVGGLLLSQVLTLYTTPVIYIFFDSLAQRFSQLAAVQHGDGLGARGRQATHEPFRPHLFGGRWPPRC